MDAKPLIQVGIAFIFLGIVAFSYREGSDITSEKTGKSGRCKPVPTR